MITINDRNVVTIDDIDYPIVYQFPVAIKGWKMDSNGYIILFGGKYRVIWSDYSRYFMLSDKHSVNNDSEQVRLLKGFLRDYQILIEKTQHALKLINS